MKNILLIGRVAIVIGLALAGAPAQTRSIAQDRNALTIPALDKTRQAKSENQEGDRSGPVGSRSGDFSFYYNLGVKNALSGQEGEAAKAFRSAIRLNPRSGDAYFSLGNVYSQLGQWAEAIEAYRSAIRLNPRDGEAQNNLGTVYFEMGMYGPAVEALKQAVRSYPTWAEPYFNLGNACYKLGQYDAAVASYKQAIRLRPDYAARPSLIAAQAQAVNASQNGSNALTQESASTNYKPAGQGGQAYHREPSLNGAPATGGRKKEEQIQTNEAIKNSPVSSNVSASSPVATNAAATAIEVSPKMNTAQPAARPKQNDAKAYYNLGEKYGRSKQYGEALEAFQQAVRLKPDYADAYYGLGHAYADLGRWKESVAAYEQVIRLNPKDDEAFTKLGEAYARMRTQAEVNPQNGNAVAVSEKVGATAPAVSPLTELAPPPTKATPASTTGSESAKTNDTATARTPSVKESPKAPLSVRANGSADPTSLYRVGAGDVLDISLLNSPAKLPNLFTVSASGLLTDPLTNRPLQVAGLTTDEIRERLASELKGQASAEQQKIVVGVHDYASHNIIVSGLVGDPGTKVLRREAIPLYVVIADAQPLPEAGRALIISHATGKNLLVDLSDPEAMGALVHPGDVITVQARPQQFFYIGGEVRNPGEKTFHSGITLTQAVLAAGGITGPISETVEVARQGAGGLLMVNRYNIRNIKLGKVPDPRLQAGDRVEVGH